MSFCVLGALQNAQKCAKASRVVVRLREGEGTLAFEVADDSAAFDTSTVRKGAGLTNMNDRVAAFGGSIQVSSQPGAGTCDRGALNGARAGRTTLTLDPSGTLASVGSHS